MKKLNLTKEQILNVVNDSKTMEEASRKLGLHFNTFRRYAKKYNCYSPNQGGKGTKKPCPPSKKIQLEDILNGKYPDYQTYKLKLRLIEEGYKEDKCEICGWNKKIIGNKYTPCELHHLNGDRHDHSLKNLIIICPNCHSLQDHYRSRNQKEHQDWKQPE